MVAILETLEGSTDNIIRSNLTIPNEVVNKGTFNIFVYPVFEDNKAYYNPAFSIDEICVINIISPSWKSLEEISEDFLVECLIETILHEELHTIMFLLGHDIPELDISHYGIDIIENYLLADNEMLSVEDGGFIIEI